jgi:predicted TIM-barrel fold metal-dependent hydrolase
MIIDAQVHAYERNHPGRPWVNRLHGPPEMTGDQMIAAMDEAGVDAAVIVSAWTMYRDDASYAVEARNAHPGRFALVKPLDPTDPAVEETIADWARTPGAVAVRVISIPAGAIPTMASVFPETPADPLQAVGRIFAAATRHSLPVNYTCVGCLDHAAAIARAYPDCQIIIDHMGLKQPYEPPVPDDALADLPRVLNLAQHDNIALKVSGLCTLSRQGYPCDDIWEPLARAIDAFGIDRCLWGTDWTRALSMIGYKESVDVFRHSDRLSDSDRAAFLGGTLQKIYNWTPTPKGR